MIYHRDTEAQFKKSIFRFCQKAFTYPCLCASVVKNLSELNYV
jgi:hypothetical protein